MALNRSDSSMDFIEFIVEFIASGSEKPLKSPWAQHCESDELIG
jgi:hypothetical protein